MKNWLPYYLSYTMALCNDIVEAQGVKYYLIHCCYLIHHDIY